MFNKIKNFFKHLFNSVKSEDFIILTLVLGVFATLCSQFSRILNESNFNLLISIVAIALAYATFFINYQKNLGNEKDKERIKMLIDGLFISSFFPIIAILFIGEDIGFGSFDKYIAYIFVGLIMISIFIASFCIIELWWYVVKNVFKK